MHLNPYALPVLKQFMLSPAFSWELYETFKNTYFVDNLWKATSASSKQILDLEK